MNENKKGYWVYSVFAVIFGMGLLAFLGWLIYNLVVKLATTDITNDTVIQSLFTLVITVFIGGYFSKDLEHKNTKKLELYKIQTKISLNIIDLASEYYRHPENDEIKHLLICESNKVKLYFNDDVLKSLNLFIGFEEGTRVKLYNDLMDKLRDSIK